MTAIEFISITLGVMSIVLAWFFGTRRNRLKKKLKQKQNRLKTIEKYISPTGYKNMLHDCFHVFSYVGGFVLLAAGVKPIFSIVITNQEYLKAFDLFVSGIHLGTGLVLIELFIVLGKASKPKESVQSLKNKIEAIEADLS